MDLDDALLGWYQELADYKGDLNMAIEYTLAADLCAVIDDPAQVIEFFADDIEMDSYGNMGGVRKKL